MTTRVADGNDPVTGHIISTTIGGKNGEPKQVTLFLVEYLFDSVSVLSKGSLFSCSYHRVLRINI